MWAWTHGECHRESKVTLVVVQVVKTGGTPKVPDCFQRTPKKLCIPEKTEILAVNVDSKGKPFIVLTVYILCHVWDIVGD